MQTLTELFFEQEGKVVDKWEQYLGIYEAEFFPILSSGAPIRLLEVGIQNGGSLELWGKYLPAGSQIIGVDIDEKCGGLQFANPNISVHVMDAADPYAMARTFEGQTFDVIIDDGSHISSDIIQTFKLMYPFLSHSGKYIIEDLECSYYKTHEGGLHDPKSSIEWLKNLVDAVNADHIVRDQVSVSGIQDIIGQYRTSIGRVTFYDSVAVIEKLPAQKNRPYQRMLSGRDRSVVPAFELLALQPQSVYRPMFYGAAAAKELDQAIISAYESTRTKLGTVDQSIADMRSMLEGEIARARRTTASLYEILAVRDAHIATLNLDVAAKQSAFIEKSGIADALKIRVEALSEIQDEKDQLAFRLKSVLSLLRIAGAQGTLTPSAWSAHAIGFGGQAGAGQPVSKLSPVEMRKSAADQLIKAVRTYATLLFSTIKEHESIINQYKDTVENYEYTVKVQTYEAKHQEYHVRALRISGKLLNRRIQDCVDTIGRLQRLLGQLQTLLSRPYRVRAWDRVRGLFGLPTQHEIQPLSLIGVQVPDLHSLDHDDVALLADSGLFDSDFYLETNPDVASSAVNPIQHFLASGGIEGRDPHIEFNTKEYWIDHPDVAEQRLNPLAHFIQSGSIEGRLFRSGRGMDDEMAFAESRLASPESALLGVPRGTDGMIVLTDHEAYSVIRASGLFDADYYAARYPDLDPDHQDLLLHFISTGWKQDRNPSPIFDMTYYREKHMRSIDRPANPLLHFIMIGASQNLPTSSQMSRDVGGKPIDFRDPDVVISLIEQSRLFDPDFYRNQRPDLVSSEGEELRHYVGFGAQEKLDPCLEFSTSGYTVAYPDVIAAGLNPLLHYIIYGAKEGRIPRPVPPSDDQQEDQTDFSPSETGLIRESGLFDDEWYRSHYDDVRRSGDEPFSHFMRYGLSEGRKPNAMFDPVWYGTFYTDVVAAGANPFLHYLQWGAFEGRSPCVGFDGQWYLEQNPDVVASGENPLKHYMRIGQQEGRLPLDPNSAYRQLVLRDRQILVVERDEILRHVAMMQVLPHFVIFIEGVDATLRMRTRESVARQLYAKYDVLDAERIAEIGDSTRHDDDVHLLWLREGDILHERALYEFASEINADPTVALIYGDEDRMSDGRRLDPFFKPDWSPDYLESLNYIGAAGCFRLRDAWDLLSGASSLYDFVLQFTERHPTAVHVRKVLCHVHRQPIRSADAETMKSCEEALHGRLRRTGRRASVTSIVPEQACFDLKSQSDYRPLVSIVIPTAGRSANLRGGSLDLLSNCIDKIIAVSTYTNLEFIIVDNGDLGAERADALERSGYKRVTYTDPKFNIAKKLNMGAQVADGELLLLLNDDVEPLVPDWIERLVEHFEKDHVGVVGSKLLYPDLTTQHVGVVLNAGIPDHVRRFQPRDDDGYFFSTSAVRNFMAVTGACMMTRASTFSEVGGYTEAFAINYNDVDYCLKVIETGKTIVYAPKSELIHFESQSREARVDVEEISSFAERWGAYTVSDPYYNERTLTVASPTFEIANNPRLL